MHVRIEMIIDMYFNRRLLVACICFCICMMSYSANFEDESLRYVVSYKWGLIQKDAGEATLMLRNRGNDYDVVLSAKTKPWADKFFMVRDTLKSTIVRNGFKPKRYVKIAHEGGKFSKDEITYTYVGNTVLAECVRHRVKKGKVSNTKKTLSASREAYDMLSIFYFLRALDYDNMPAGKIIRTTVFSGSKSEIITIKNLGIETITLRNKAKRRAYHIRFNFTTEGGRKSSDDMDTWVSVDRGHVPLQLEGNLPLGKIKCYLID